MNRWLIDTRTYLIAGLFLLVTVLLRWRLTPDIGIGYFLVGGVIGLHLLEVMEKIYGEGKVFRSVIGQAVVTVLSIYVVTSSGSLLGAGVVLGLSLRYILLQHRDYAGGRLVPQWFGRTVQSLTSTQQQRYIQALYSILVLITIIFTLL